MKEIYKLIKDWLFEFYKDKIIFSRQITCSLSQEKYDVRVGIIRIVPHCPYIRKGYKCEAPITSADGADKQNKKRKLRGNNRKCYIANKKDYSRVCFLFLVILFIIFVLIKDREIENFQGDSARKVISHDERIIQGVSYFNRQMELLNLGPLEIGGEMAGGHGDHTFAPYLKIPVSKFYVSVMEPNSWCINEDCNLDGAFIQTMGGWLGVNHTGDPITHLSDKLAEFAPNIPKDKKFYLYSIEKKKYDIVGMYLNEPSDNEYACFISGCRYPEPDPPHDFLYAEIDELGGWFLANDQNNSEMVELFGFQQDEVLEGRVSLVILTDSDGIIRAIHPNKTSSDAFTILSQHPEIADIRGLYR